MTEQESLIPILIVDDSQENLLVLEAVLRNPRYEIIEAHDGPEALEKVSQREFAVILLDVQMPGMNGYEVTKKIRELRTNISTPVIFVTAGMNESNLVQLGYEAGAVDYLFKPIEPVILRSKVSVFTNLYSIKKQNEKQAELLRIHDQEERDSFLESALDAVIGMNEEGRIIYWNRQAEIIFGWSKEEALGEKLATLVIPKYYRPEHELGLKNFLKYKTGPILNKRIEVMSLRRDGSEFPVELAVVAIKTNAHYTFSAFVRDISDRKREQMKIKTTEENLKKAIQARDEFISVCSHELKTPLTSMQIQFQLGAKMMKDGNEKVFERESVIKRIDIANKQLKRMGKLIDNMLEVSRIASGKLIIDRKEIDLFKLIHDLLDMYQEQLDYSHIDVNLISKIKSPVLIEGDSYRIEQVLSNLISNAIKYGENRPIDIVLDVSGESALISVRDHGLGIDQENIERIFDRYERAITASEISGLGLGLYISKQIVEAHHGHLRVESQKGQGSTFTVELPMHKEHTELSH